MRSAGYCSRPVCQCVQASHPLLTQLQDQVDIPMDSVSCSLQNEFGVFRRGRGFQERVRGDVIALLLDGRD